MAARETAIVFGVGPGLGWALARRFLTDGMQVGVVARDKSKLNSMIGSGGFDGINPYAADVSNGEDVLRVFESVDRDLGEPDLVVFNAGAFRKASVLDIDPAEFERCWRIGCLGGLLVGQGAARRMVKRGHGTIILNAYRVLSSQMAVYDRIGYRNQQTISTVATLDARLFANAGAPLVGAGWTVPGLAGGLALPADWVDIRPPAK